MLFFILLKIKKCNYSNAIFISSLFLIYQDYDYDYEEPKKEGKAGKAEKDSKDGKKEEKGSLLLSIWTNL